MKEKNILTKEYLRNCFIQARKRLTADEIKEKSRSIAARIREMQEYRTANTVLIFYPMPGEPDLMTLTEQTGSSDPKHFAFPVCVSRNEMKAMIPGKWKKGIFGIPEPDPDNSEIISPGQIDLVICPGVAFDEKRTRLGMGGGFYDRYLPACKNAFILMAAFEIQHTLQLPKQHTDIAMNRIVTESAVYE